MLELTEQQWQSLDVHDANPTRLENPLTQERFVLVPEAEYVKLMDDGYDYDDTGFTEEDRNYLALERIRRAPENMDEYDLILDKS